MSNLANRTCAACKYSERVRPNAMSLETIQMCYLNPPVTYPIQTQPGQVGMCTQHPIVKDDDWCFQYEANLRVQS